MCNFSAFCFAFSTRDSSTRNEIKRFDGFRFGKLIFLRSEGSRYSEKSVFSINFCTSSSFLKSGSLSGFFIDWHLLSVHWPCRDTAYFFVSYGKCNNKPSPFFCFSE